MHLVLIIDNDHTGRDISAAVSIFRLDSNRLGSRSQRVGEIRHREKFLAETPRHAGSTADGSDLG